MNPSYPNILCTIGHTPIVPLRRLGSKNGAQIFGKYEAANPSSSLKDRITQVLIKDLEAKGRLSSSSTVVVASNGNTAISLAMLCAVRAYKLHVFMSKGVSQEKQKIPLLYGAKMHLIQDAKDFQKVQDLAREFAKKENAVFIDQFDLALVSKAHAESTAKEILADFPDGVDALVMCVETGGTITGVGRVLKKKFPQTLICAVEMGLGFVPKNLDIEFIDRTIKVTERAAYLMTKKLAREEGLLLGMSSGANMIAALQLATELGAGKKILTVFCDQGQRYFSLEKKYELHEGTKV